MDILFNSVTTTTEAIGNTTEPSEVHVTVSCTDLVIEESTVRNNQVEGLVLAVALNFLSLFVAVLLMWLISRCKRGYRVLVPKKSGGGRLGLPHEWFRDAYKIQYDDMDQISIDGQVVIRLCLLGLKFSAFGTLVACVLVPIYASTKGPQTGVLAYSMSNLTSQDDDYVFWIVVVGAYLLVLNFFWLIRAEWRYFIKLRQDHFMRRATGKEGEGSAQAQYSLIVERLPKKFQDTVSVAGLFSQIFPRQVHSAVAQRDTLLFYHLRALKRTSDSIVVCTCCQGCVHRQLEKTVQLERAVARRYRQAEKYVSDFAMDGQVDPELRENLMQQMPGLQVPLSLPGVKGVFGGETAEQGDEEAPRERRKPRLQRSQHLNPESECPPSSTAFVTLKKLADRVLAEQIPLFDAGQDEAGMESIIVAPAPEARAIIWENVQLPVDQVLQRQTVGRALCVVGILFWSIPITSIQALSSQQLLQAMLSAEALEWFQTHAGVVYSLIVGYFTVLALLVLLVILPIALNFIGVFVEARKSRTEVDKSVMQRNLWFQFFSLWLMVFSSSLANSVWQIMDHPGCLATILGNAIPQVSVYFTTFVIARIGLSLPLLLLRLDALKSLIVLPRRSAPNKESGASSSTDDGSASSSESDEASETPVAPVYCYFASEVTNITIVFVLALMYCVVAPIMMPACMIYFGLAFGVYKWLFVHVYSKEIDLLGECWYPVFWGLIVGMAFGTVSLAGLAAVQKGPRSPHCIALWVLSFSVGFFANHCQKTFKKHCSVLPFRAAVQADESGASRDLNFTSDYYKDPILRDMTEDDRHSMEEALADSEEDGDTCCGME